ncbi:MAG: hypothetical protein RML45_05115 [Acetobacteraceae bacterium]|nr:hypothetical protein [Acetobacteraceae bacterium]
MAGRDGAGPDWEEAQAAIRELKHLEQQEAAAHARRYRRGEVLTPVAWYEVDARANYRPDDAWAWGRLTATPEGVHYISHQLDKGGPRLVVSPDIAPWIQYSTIAPGDKYGQQ